MSTKSVDIASGATPGKKGPGRFDDLSLEELVALLDEQDPAVSVNLFFTSFAKQARRSRKGGFTGCANVFSPIPVTA